MKYTAVILAGGESSRMKTNKAFCEIKGKKLINYLIETFEKRNYEILISGEKEIYKSFNKEIIEDNYVHIGPLAGIEAGLKACKTENVIFSSCDTPFISELFIQKMEFYLSKYEIIVPKMGIFWQPMNAFYSKHLHSKVLKLIQKKRFYPKDLIRTSKYKEISITDSKEFFNINTQEDLIKAQLIIKQLSR